MESSLLSRVTMIKRWTLDVSDVHQRLLHVNLATRMVPFNQVKWWYTLAKPCSVSPILLRVKPVLSTACEAFTCSARPRCLSGLGPHYRCPQPPPLPSSCPLDRLQSLAQARHSPTSQLCHWPFLWMRTFFSMTRPLTPSRSLPKCHILSEPLPACPPSITPGASTHACFGFSFFFSPSTTLNHFATDYKMYLLFIIWPSLPLSLLE